MTVAEALRAALKRADGVEDAARVVRQLMAFHLGISQERLLLFGPETLPNPETWERLFARLLQGEPVTRIMGKRQFWGREFVISPAVLDPRPDTETLIEAALHLPAPERLIDLGTGSGCIAITLLAEWPNTTGIATDISREAMQIADTNTEAQGVADRLTLLTSDWWAGVEGQFDLIVSNPPYISEAEMAGLSTSVRDFDPVGALTPGGDGLAAYREICEGFEAHLAPGGHVFFEIGWQQGTEVKALLERHGLIKTAILRDIEGRDRVVTGKKL